MTLTILQANDQIPRHVNPGVLSDGRIEMKFRTNGTKRLKLWLYRFLPDVEVVSPKGLKEEIRKELKEAAGKI